MVEGLSEVAAMCIGLVGLIGAAATTGMPMWKVTAFIGENIIVMETRWEGLWMNCYRQANIRMQCKVYDSLLFLPADLQAARGLMCCSLALSGVGLLVALAGMRCTSCVQNNDRVKTLILMVAGGLQFAASISVFIPVSWTGHVIIRDFYNPLLIDAQRRELGEALYIGWVTGAFLFASGVLFVCRRVPSNKGSFDVYHPPNALGYDPTQNNATLMMYHPISSVPSVRRHQPGLQSQGFVGQHHHQVPSVHNVNVPLAPNGVLNKNPPAGYNPGLLENGPVYHSSMGGHVSSQSSNFVGSLSTPGHSIYMSRQTSPYSVPYGPAGNPSPYSYGPVGNPTPYSHGPVGNLSYNSSFHAVPHNPVFFGYNTSQLEGRSLRSHSGSSPGVYI